MKLPQESNNTAFDQWKLCVEMADSVSKRRNTMNNLFATINTAIIAAISVGKWSWESLLLLIAGITLCLLWQKCIQNYKKLNSAKYQIINEIEKELTYSPFTEEWNQLVKDNQYKEETSLERILPVVFIVLYLIAILAIIILSILSR